MIAFLQDLAARFPEWAPLFVVSAGITLRLSAYAMVIALLIGMIVVLLRYAPFRSVRWFAVAYVEVGRGTPPLVILFMIYFGLQDLSPALQFDSFTAAAIGLGLQGGAVLGEVFRSGVEAIHRGQREAAMSLGLTPVRTAVDVIIPQAVRIVLPAFGNYAVGLVKDTSIASVIAVPEIMLRAKDLASVTFMPMHLYVMAALTYLAISLPVSLFVRGMERSAMQKKKS